MKSKEAWKICNNNKTYTVAISARMNWNEARMLCGRLGGGNITEVKNERENDQIVSLFDGKQSTCHKVWSPIARLVKVVSYNKASRNVTANLVITLRLS